LRRAANYFRFLQSRHSAGLAQRFFLVPGVAHNARKMLPPSTALIPSFERVSAIIKNVLF
jgi:hypothetical protein